MKKSHDNLSENQQRIINGLIEEFSKNNEKKPKAKSSSFIDALADEGNEYLRKKEIFYATIDENNAEVKAKAREDIYSLTRKLKELFKDYKLDITSYEEKYLLIVHPPEQPANHLIRISTNFPLKLNEKRYHLFRYDANSPGREIFERFEFSIDCKKMGTDLEKDEVFKNAVREMFKKHKIQKK